jgi:hypothetical protein
MHNIAEQPDDKNLNIINSQYLRYQAVYFGFLPKILMKRPKGKLLIDERQNESDLEEEKEEILDPIRLIDPI